MKRGTSCKAVAAAKAAWAELTSAAEAAALAEAAAAADARAKWAQVRLGKAQNILKQGGNGMVIPNESCKELSDAISMDQIVSLVNRMRQLQIEYYLTQSPSVFHQKNAVEKRVDMAIDAHNRETSVDTVME